MAEPEPENPIAQNTPNLKDILKFGGGELHKRIGQFLTSGAGFKLGQAMGDMGMRDWHGFRILIRFRLQFEQFMPCSTAGCLDCRHFSVRAFFELVVLLLPSPW